MDLEKLSCLCRWLNLSVNDFIQFSGKSEAEIWCDLQLAGKLKKDMTIYQSKHYLQTLLNSARQHIILYPGHSLYPRQFMNIDCPPVFLNLSGDLDAINVSPKLAIVGARDAEFRYLQWMEEHLPQVCQSGEICLISGGARGVDQKVTCVAEKYEAPHLIFIPSGLNSPYPTEIKNYYFKKNITIISEYFPMETMQKGHFLSRNRLISAISDCVLVVQAAQKSGTMITAKYAIEQNKDIATLPDFPGCMKSSGNLSLLRDGAHMVANGEDLIQLLLS